jgi:hypothetical protein
MAKRISDSVPAVIGGGIILLSLFFHSIYEDLLKAAVLKRLSAVIGIEEAELVSRLTEMALPIMGAVAVVWFLYIYLKREMMAQIPDQAIEAQRQHTAAIVAQTEAIKATAQLAESARVDSDGSKEETILPADRSFPFGLFISNIWIQRPFLAERSVIHINLDGFNGTGEDIFLKSVEGQIAIRTESLKPVGKLAPPTLVGVRNTRIGAFNEFTFTLEQDVPKRFATELMGEEKLDRNFVFDGLDIVVQAVNDRLKIARLPLWDGAALVRNGENIRADRMIFFRAPQAPEIIEMRSDAARLVDAASAFVEFEGRIQDCIDRIDGSNHPIWLDFDARNARSRFLQLGRVARTIREEHGPTFGDDMETRGEVLGALIEAKLTLDRILSNYHGQ